MAYSLIELKTQLAPSNNNTSPEAMAIIVAQMKEQAKLKGFLFNCVVINRDNKQGDELVQFLSLLEKNKHALKDQRIQVVYLHKEHWSTLDIQIKQGALDFFLLDAANSLPTVLNAFTTLYTYCPGASLKYSGPNTQSDNLNCSYFSVVDAFNLAKIADLHTILTGCVKTDNLGMYTLHE